MKPFIPALLALAVSACAVGPDYQAPETQPARITALEAGDYDRTDFESAWWQQFDDPTLNKLEQTAAAMKDQMMTELLAKNPAPDKEKNQMAWVQHMNSLQEQVEEVIRTELIYS